MRFRGIDTAGGRADLARRCRMDAEWSPFPTIQLLRACPGCAAAMEAAEEAGRHQ
jgi:hypothetical protein